MTQRRHGTFTALAVLSSCCWLADAAFAQESESPGPPIEAHRLAEGQRIELDGALSEEAWRLASPVSDFTQQEPVEGATPSRVTEVRVVYDADNLFIGAMLYDDPDRIIANQRERDAFLFSDDRFSWVLDTFQDGRTGYNFEVNPAGAMSDGLITSGGGGGFGGGNFGGVNRSWDGIWEARTRRLEDGWSVEVRIPFRTLNFDPSADTWGINFQRSIERNNEQILWRGWRRNEGLNRLVNAGELTGLGNLSQGIGLEAVLSGIQSWKNTPANDDATEFPRDVSLDVNYSVTPSLRASVSINTDFAEVETDQRRVNLTRFPLRFPERRDFFLEGSSAFSFAPSSGPEPFFSRRIGLGGGEPIPIDFGARLTGQLGSREIGFYQMRTGSHALTDPDADPARIEAEDFTVARVKQQFLEQSSVGVIYTRRHTAQDSAGYAPADRHTLGVDLALNTRHFFGNNNFDVEAFWVWNSNPEPDAVLEAGERRPSFRDLSARGLRLNFPNDIWDWRVSYREFGADYDPAVGFVTRNNYRRLEPRFAWSPRPAIDWIRRFQFSVQYQGLWQLDTGRLEQREWRLHLFEVDFESGDNVSFEIQRQYEFLDEPFEISDGVDVMEGGYSYWEYHLQLRTASRRLLSLRADTNLGGFWDGTRTRYNLNLTLRPTPGVSLTGSFERNDVSLSGGDFDTELYRVEGGFDPSPWIGFTSQLQYDSVSRIIGLFARARWILKPGNDIYVVYTHNWQDYGDGLIDDPSQRGFVTLSRGATIKLNYTYRF